MKATQYIRRVIFKPYSFGPQFILTLKDDLPNGRISYSLVESRNGIKTTIFEGADFKPSPLHSIDGDETVKALMGFLTLRPGDTDREYFESYSETQLEFANHHGEALACEVYSRFGE